MGYEPRPCAWHPIFQGHITPLGDPCAIMPMSNCEVCTAYLWHAGITINLTVAATNTGNVTLKGVMIGIPDVFRPAMVCTIGFQPYNITTSSLQPGGVLTCKSTYVVRLSDLEDGDHSATMTATAPTADLSVSRDITFVSQWRPEVSIEMNSAACSSVPAKAGENGAACARTYLCTGNGGLDKCEGGCS